jgi:lysophospholipase L1-like esterase
MLKVRDKRFKAMAIPLFMGFLITAFSGNAPAQTKRIMPFGNSITWGKSDLAPPVGHGYRSHLYDLLKDGGFDIQFAGPTGSDFGTAYLGDPASPSSPDGPYFGYYVDGARLDQFLPQASNPSATYDVEAMLNAMPMDSLPDIIILHLGTNDIGTEQIVGDAGDAYADSSMMGDFGLLLQTLLTYNRSGHTFEQIFVSKIIPASPYAEYPGFNTKIVDYNTKIQDWYDNLGSADRDRVTLVNMYTPFYRNQLTYYNVDDNPATTGEDHIHPNPAGYEAMASYWSDYMIDYLAAPEFDEFNRTAGTDLNGNNNWVATDTDIQIYDVGESPGGAIGAYDGVKTDWNSLAIWDNSLGLNSVSITIDENSSTDRDTLSGLGILFGMDSTNPAVTNGYMVFIRSGRLYVYVVDTGAYNQQVGSTSFPNLDPGDVLKVVYSSAPGNNIFYFYLNGGSEAVIYPTISLLDNADDYYSGVIFRDGTYGNRLMVDRFECQSQLIDLYAPAQITNFYVLATANTSVTLQWTAVGDDGNEPGRAAASYELRYSQNPITVNNFEDANIVGSVPPPKSAGSSETFTVKGLLSGRRYYFAIRAVDLYGNQGELSNDVTGVTKSTGLVEDPLNSLADWDYNPAEYSISGGEIVNIGNDDDWGTPAIYKGRTNPTIVQMVWGSGATNSPSSDVENGGLIVLADDSSYTDASGYFIFVRSAKDLIYLFDLDNGALGDQLDAIAYDTETLGSAPDAGDTLTVVMDTSEEEYNKFDVYVNGKPASRFSLYDTGKRHGAAARNYSGLLLAQLDGIRDNSVTAFITSGEPSGAAEIVAAGPTSFEGTVNEWLSDSAGVAIVELRDDNNLPLQGIPVFFLVSEGGGDVSVPYSADEHIRIEAEWGNPVPPMVELDDPTASGGSYIISTQRGGDNRGYATFKFYVENTGTYYFWGRVRGVSYWNTWVMQFELEGKTPVGGFAWWLLHNDPITGDWQWDMVKEEDGSSPYSVLLTPGVYTLKIITAHENVQLDKLLITTNPGYVPSGKETQETLLTDSDGQVATAWKLGITADNLVTPENEGLNTLIARTFSTDQTVEFTATGRPADPVSIDKDADNLEGASGDTLDLPVTLYDMYANRTPGQTVTFTVLTGDGWLADGTESVVTDDGGQAVARLVLGPQDSVFTVQASFTGYTGPDVIITARATAGLVSSLQDLTVDQSFFVNQTYPNYLQVKVLDDLGQPVVGIPVGFAVVQGDARTGVVPSKWTDSNGIARDTLFTGPTAGLVEVEARTSQLAVTLVEDSVFYKGAKMQYLSGSFYQLTPGQLSPGPLRVVILDKNNLPVEGHPVTYIITDPNTGFKFHNGSTVFVDTTDSDGIAKQAYVRAGSLHGTYQGIVEASAEKGFGLPVDNSPYPFTCHVKSLAYEMVKVEGDGLSGVVGSIVGPLKVQMLKSDGQPIGGQPVTFRTIAGNGSFDDATSQPKVDVFCDENGYATTYYWLGSEAGTLNNHVVAYTINVDDSISTLFRLSAKSSNADTMLAATSTQIQDVVGKPQTVKVKVRDTLGNPVNGEEVVFTVTLGGGTLDYTASGTVTKTTDSTGTVTVIWTLGTEAGTNNNRLQAIASDGINPVKGAPLIFTASAGPDQVSISVSEIEATSPVQAVPDSICWITVTLMDNYRNPISGKVVDIHVEGDQWDVWQRQTAPTDEEGKANSFLQSPTAGLKKIRASVDGDTLDAEKTVIFLANDATTLIKYDVSSGDGQVGNIGTVLQEPFVVQITDGFNPVPYGPVYFSVLGDKGEILEAQPVVSDSGGLAKAYLKLSNTAGAHYVQVTSPGLAGSPTFSATARVSEASGMDYPYDGYDYDLEGVAGEVMQEPFIVKVFDTDGLPIAGESVTFIVDTPGSDGQMVGSQPIITDEYGYARGYYRMHTKSDTLAWIKATHPAFPYYVWFKAFSQAGSPRKIQAVTPTTLNVDVGQSVAVQVEVTDNFGNPKNGVSVSFEVIDGDATITQGGLTVTNEQGIASATATMGLNTGEVTIWASGTALEGSPVVFEVNVTTTTQMAQDIIRYPQTQPQPIFGTVGQFLPNPLRAQVIDMFGNGVPGQTVIFRLIDGEGYLVNSQGQLVTTQLINNDENGIASIRFKTGSTPEATSMVTAEWTSAKKDTFYIRAVNNPHYPELDDSYIYPSYNIEEGQDPPLKIFLVGHDIDPSDQLFFQIGNLMPPEGTEIVPQSDTSAIFQWSPGYDQAGTYDIVLQVLDGRGGWDEKTVRIFVQDINRPPMVLNAVPGSDTTVVAGQTIMFWVEARDPDHDVLTYLWKVNNQPVPGNQPVYYYSIDKYQVPGSQTVTVLVSDAAISVPHAWSLLVTSAVEISEMSALFIQDQRSVQLRWTTSRETDHLGFDVYRADLEEGPYEKLNAERIVTEEGKEYTYTDPTVKAGRTYYYKIVDVDVSGYERWHEPLRVEVPLPHKFEMAQNYPNPFNPVTTIRYQLPSRQKVTLKIYNMLGQHVVTLVDGDMDAGYHAMEWDGRDMYGREVATGIYIYRLTGEKQTRTLRMVKLR